MHASIVVTQFLFAGRGSVLNLEKGIQMDALIMDGRNLKAGTLSKKIPPQVKKN